LGGNIAGRGSRPPLTLLDCAVGRRIYLNPIVAEINGALPCVAGQRRRPRGAAIEFFGARAARKGGAAHAWEKRRDEKYIDLGAQLVRRTSRF